MMVSSRPRRGHFSASGLVGAIAGLTAVASLVGGALRQSWELLVAGCVLAAFTLLCVRIHRREGRGT